MKAKKIVLVAYDMPGFGGSADIKILCIDALLPVL